MTTINFKSDSIHSLEIQFFIETNASSQYFALNNLHLNADFLNFNLNTKDINSGPCVVLGEKLIKEVHSAMFLSLIIYNQLTWKKHINSM